MAQITTFAMILLTIIGHNRLRGIRIGRKKTEVIHKGKSLQDLVVLDSHITPHDLEYLSAFVKPKLLEDSKAEGTMLQKNGIEDFRPLDVSMETDEVPSDGQQFENEIDQASVADNSNKNGDYDLRNMPEYNLETKADFKGNQEAIDWMMKDPNDYNVKSYEDSVMDDTDNFGQSKYSTRKEDEDDTENNSHSFHHKNYGSKRHHGTSLENSDLQDLGGDVDDTHSPLNEMNTRHNRNYDGKTARWKNKSDNDDYENSEYFENVGNGKKSWDDTDGDFHDDIINDKDREDDADQSPRETTMRNLNDRIMNQDARLFRELDNFRNIDNFGNIDDSDSILGDLNGHHDEYGDKNEGIESHYDSEDEETDLNLKQENADNNQENNDHGSEDGSKNSDHVNKISNSHEKEVDNNQEDDDSESESENEDFNDEIATSHSNDRKQEDGNRESENKAENSDNEDKMSNERKAHNDQEDNDQESESENKSQNTNASDQAENKNGNDDTMYPKSSSRVNKQDKSASLDDEKDEINDKEEGVKSKANNVASDQEISNIKTKHANRDNKLKEMTQEETDHTDKQTNTKQNTQSSTSTENKSAKNQEERIVNEIEGNVISSNEKEDHRNNGKLLQEAATDSKSENVKQFSTENVGHEDGIKPLSLKVENDKHPTNKDLNLVDSKLSQETHIGSKIKNEDLTTDKAGHEEQITSAFPVPGNGKQSANADSVIRHSNSDTHQASPSIPEYNRKIITADKPLITTDNAGTSDSNKQQLIHKNGEDTKIKVEQDHEEKLPVKFKRPTLNERTKGQLRQGTRHNHYSKVNGPTTTGFRRNQPNYGPSSRIYSLSDLQRMQNIVSYLRGTETSRSSPTGISRYSPRNFSLQSLYYYPKHPTPQEQTEPSPGTKDARFSEWNDWSTCSVTCGKGTSVRARVCLVTTCPQKDLVQTKTCRKSICSDEMERESLEEHNKLRAKHFSPPLRWSYSLAREAKKIAQSLAAKDFLTLDDLREPHGESIAQIQNTDEHSARKAIDKWYSEITAYSFSDPKISEKTRHFMQIVWKATKEMGLAVAKSPSGDYAFVVALYSPSIDSKGRLRQNVLRPGVKTDLYSTFRRSTQ